jgi:hypothetical protein
MSRMGVRPIRNGNVSDPSGTDKSRDSAASLIGQQVVLDTAGSVLFLGTLRTVEPDGFWLDQADVHDRDEGHATKELYVCEARRHGIRANRRSLFVYRSSIISISRLDDVVID